MGYAARMTIHITHRFGAIIATCCIVLLVVQILRSCQSIIMRRAAWSILGLLCLQVALGISHIVYRFPVPIGVLHNATAALLLLSCLFVWMMSMNAQGEPQYAPH